MAELSAFSFRPGQTRLHKLDIRCKLVLLIGFNLISLRVSPFGLLLLAPPLLLLFSSLRIPIIRTLGQIRLFFVLLLFVLLSRMFFMAGDELITLAGLIVTQQGLSSGLLFCGRLMAILVGSIIFVATSSSMEIKTGLEWFLKPLPFVPEKRIGIMISLMIRFIPLIFEQAAEINNAQKARAVENIKNPVRRLILFSIPLLVKTFQTADRLVVAMEARCYSEDRTDPELFLHRQDLLLSFLTLIYLCICLLP